jgi:hypothetical protein
MRGLGFQKRIAPYRHSAGIKATPNMKPKLDVLEIAEKRLGSPARNMRKQMMELNLCM